jgi:hypothetical protein
MVPVSLRVLALLLSSASALAGPVGGLSLDAQSGPNPVAPPNSHAYGKSLNEWMGTYWRQFLAGNLVGEKKVTFLPISCDNPPCTFDITIKPGTPLVLPLAAWLGFNTDDPVALPDEWWGDPDHIFTETTLDGRPIAEPNAAYYVGPTYFEPPIQLDAETSVLLYQTIGVVIKPLSTGVHQIVLHSEFVDLGASYDNTWNITVSPPGRQ